MNVLCNLCYSFQSQSLLESSLDSVQEVWQSQFPIPLPVLWISAWNTSWVTRSYLCASLSYRPFEIVNSDLLIPCGGFRTPQTQCWLPGAGPPKAPGRPACRSSEFIISTLAFTCFEHLRIRLPLCSTGGKHLFQSHLLGEKEKALFRWPTYWKWGLWDKVCILGTVSGLEGKERQRKCKEVGGASSLFGSSDLQSNLHISTNEPSSHRM